jgi:hypothetical protein
MLGMRGLSIPPALCLAVAAACSGSAPARVPDPQLAAERFVRALRDDRPQAAYAMLDPELRALMPPARFELLWRDNRAEMQALAREIEATDSELLALARLPLQNGEQVVLVLEQGRWRIAGGSLAAQSPHTPPDAVASLRRALRRQSLPGLLRVLSRERRAAWLAAFEHSLEQTSDGMDLRVDVQGDEAVVHLSGGGQILLKREAGRWHVWDVQASTQP